MKDNEKAHDQSREARENVLMHLENLLHAAGMESITLKLNLQIYCPDKVDIMVNGKPYKEACIECDSLPAMIQDVLEVIL